MDLGDAKYTVSLDDKATGKLKDIESSMKTMSTSFSKAGLVMAGVGIAIGGVALKVAGDFDSAMREVNTMILLSEEQFVSLGDEIRDMSVEMGVSAVDSAKALYQAISAGVPKDNVITFLEVATKAAIGGMTDTTTAVDGLTTVINAFKLSTSDAQYVADVMFTTVRLGKTTFPELAASMSLAAPMAASLGVRFEEMLSMVATLTKQGVPTAQAFTQIRASMVALAKPTADMELLLQGLGYESGDALIQALGLEGALGALRKEAGDNSQVLAAALGSVEALGATLGVTGENAIGAADDMDVMAGATGAATDAFDQMEETTGRKMAIVREQVTDLARELGDTLMPKFKDFLEGLSNAVTRMTEWSDAHPELITNIGKTIMALIGAGGFLFAVGKIITIVLQLRNALIAVHALSGPKGWALLAGGVAVAALTIAAMNKLTSGTGVAGPTTQWGMEIGSPEWEAEQARILGLGSMASPSSSGGNVVVNVAGSVVTERDLVAAVREGLTDLSLNNAGLGF